MKTIMLEVNPVELDTTKIQIAADIIQRGGLVAFPTETVYGLGADALNPLAVSALFKAKKRPLDNPPIVHVYRIEEVCDLVGGLPEKASFLIKKFWPGPLTIIFKRSTKVPDVTVAGLDTIAIRMPSHPIALALIKQSNCSIAAPSANLSGRPSPTTAKHVFEDLNGRIDAIIDGGPTEIGIESTVIDISVNPPILLRPGGTPLEELKKVLKNLELHPFVQAEQELPLNQIKSPGMKHKHYAPKAEVILVEGDIKAIIPKINELIKTYRNKNLKIGVLATEQTKGFFKANVVMSLGSRYNLASVAQNLFRLLREIDALGIDVIITESVPSEGLGLAVMNRLRKASGYHIIRV
jgi:L-threonylcarbamoyladenylate synthase